MKTKIKLAFADVALSEGWRPTFTEHRDEAFNDIERWIRKPGYPGLLVYGERSREKQMLMYSLFDMLKNIDPDTIRPMLRDKSVIWESSYDVVHTARNFGRNGLLYGKRNGYNTPNILLLTEVGVAQEEPEIYFEGHNEGRTAYIREFICPVAELIEYRLNRNLPTIIETALDADGIRAKYRNGSQLCDTIAENCVWSFFK